MKSDTHNPVLAAPIAVRLRQDEQVIDLTLPSGATLSIQADAAARSAREILRLAKIARDAAKRPLGHMPSQGMAHPIALMRQRWRAQWRAARTSTRLLVAAILTPVALGLCSVASFVAIMHLGVVIGVIIATLCVCLAPMLAWWVAPCLMSTAELRPRTCPSGLTIVP